MNDIPEVADEDREALAGWLARYLGNYTLPANYVAPLYGQTHREIAAYCGPVIAEDLLESDWLRDHDAALTANAKAEVDDLRARLAKVEALADEWAEDYPSDLAACNYAADKWWRDLRAALANPDAAGEGK